MRHRILIFCFLFLNPLYGKELALQDALVVGLTNNPQVQEFKGQLLQVQSQARDTQGLYDWLISLSGTYEDLDQARVSVFQPSNIKRQTYGLDLEKTFSYGTSLALVSSLQRTKEDSTFSILNKRYEAALGLSVTQSLLEGFIGFPQRSALIADQLEVEAAHYTFFRSLELLAQQISKEYWSLWRDVKLWNVAQDSEKEAKDFLDETKRLTKLGLREKDDILQAEATWLERQSETLRTQNQTETSWRSLKTLLDLQNNETWNELPTLDAPETNLDRPPARDSQRLDLMALQKRVEAHQKRKEGLKGLSLPRLNAQGGYSLLGLDPNLSDTLDQIEKTQIKGWNVGMSLQHRFGQNADRSKQDLAEANLLVVRSQFKDKQNEIDRDTLNTRERLDLHVRLLNLATRIEQKKKGIKDVFRRKFSQGRISIQDLLQARDEHSRVRSSRVQAEARVSLSNIDELVATGGLLTFYNIDPERFLP